VFRLSKLEQLRKKNVLTQQELGDRAGLTKLTIHRLEQGQIRARPSTIRKIAAALNVEVNDLFDQETDGVPE
jgi:transcriptional regulator with XRE-family HTH domain